jgi:argininosuccinate lyase
MFQRDKVRYLRVRDSADVMPLGSGALAGLPYPIDRTYVADKLDFSAISENSMDAVSDRDFLLEFHSATATCAVHISRLAEDLILWSTEEFGFIRLGEEFTTGSSIMPQKRNPDFAELARGKSGRIFGNLFSLLTVLKGLPLTYNRDLQEDKEGFFDSDDTIVAILDMLPGMLSSLQVKVENTRSATEEGLLLATDVADYLVEKGLTFRESHALVSKLTDYLILKQKIFSDLTLNEYKQFSKAFDEDVLAITAQTSIEARQTYGGTATSMVSDAIARGHKRLKNSRLD